jgi:uncharacterized protein YyaL (SSP411 family)
LYESGSIEDTAKAAGMAPTEVLAILNNCKTKLWEYRSTVRPKPHRDEKVMNKALIQRFLLLMDW